MSHSRIAPKRALVQWLATILLLVLPFIRFGGDSLLRLDAGSRTLLFFGASIRIEEFYLFLIAVLIIVFGFLFDLITGSLLGSSVISKTITGFTAGYFSNENKRDFYLSSYAFPLIVLLCGIIDSFIFSFFSRK